MKVFVQQRNDPQRRSFNPSVLCLPDDYCRDHAPADSWESRQKADWLRPFTIVNVTLQKRVVTQPDKIRRRLGMADENFMIRRHQQDCEWCSTPIFPHPISDAICQSKCFGQPNAIDLS